MTADHQKTAAAQYAASYVQDGMIVGLGTGSTAERLIQALGERYAQGLRFTGVPTSRQTAHLAEKLRIPLTRLDELHRIDLTIDGADEVDPRLDLIKGHGGALMREKLVASSADKYVIIVDQSKLVARLGMNFPVPVEVVTFGWTTTRHRLESLGLECNLRGDSQPYVTSNHNYVLDCRPADGTNMHDLAAAIKQQTGVVDHGLFLGMATTVVAGHDDGTVEIVGESL